jgi:ribosome-binding ATPase
MSLSIGIVGLPNVGKSTLFNALTDNDILAANYPFATIEPNTGIVPIPDPRLNKLADLYTPGGTGLDGVRESKENRTSRIGDTESEARTQLTKQSANSESGVAGNAGKQAGAASGPRVIPATVTFVDIAGLVAGASKGEGLGNQFLANIRTCSAICHVVRAFEDSDVQHVDEQHDPAKDIDVINTELMLADLQSVDKKLPKAQKEARGNPKLKSQVEALELVKESLEQAKMPVEANFKHLDGAWEWLNKELQMLSTKPVIYVFNIDEKSISNEAKLEELQKIVAPNESIFICAKIESELKGLSTSDKKELLSSYGVEESGLEKLIHSAYSTLGLQSYLTAGPKEVRAWTIKKGSTAPQAAGVIHSDFEKGFIAAQVINYDDLVAAGSEAAVKSAGKIRTEGKTYVMQENDVVEFRFNN